MDQLSHRGRSRVRRSDAVFGVHRDNPAILQHRQHSINFLVERCTVGRIGPPDGQFTQNIHGHWLPHGKNMAVIANGADQGCQDPPGDQLLFGTQLSDDGVAPSG